MTAARRLRPEPVRDLFAVPSDVIVATLAPLIASQRPAPEVTVPRALRLRRDFAARRELIWGCDGRRFVCRDITCFNGRPAYHVYTAWEIADAGFFEVVAEGLTPAAPRAYGRIDTRRPLRRVEDAFQWLLEQQTAARELVRELCPETVRCAGESVPSSGVYDRPCDVFLTVEPAHRFAAAKASWRPA